MTYSSRGGSGYGGRSRSSYSKSRKRHGSRYLIKGKEGSYALRDREGRFTKWVSRKKSLSADKSVRAKRVPSKPGSGHRGDYR